MRILITGGAGFIGLNLAKVLQQRGHQLILVDNLSRGSADAELKALLDTGDCEFVQADLLAPSPFSSLSTEVEVIVHFAAILGVAKVNQEPFTVLKDNLRMNLAVLEYAQAQRSLQRLVFASTSEVYAGTLEHFGLSFPTPEDEPLALPSLAAPRTSYMLSKIYGEALAHHSGVPFTIIRPHNIYGPRMGMSHVVPQLMQRLTKLPEGSDLTVYSPEHKRTFCFASDAATMIADAIESQSCRNVTLNIGNQEPEVTMAGLAELIASVMGKKVRIAAGEVTAGSPPRRQPATGKITELAHTKPQVSLEEGLRITFEWYRKNVFEREERS